jgi:hypothetical protein
MTTVIVMQLNYHLVIIVHGMPLVKLMSLWQCLPMHSIILVMLLHYDHMMHGIHQALLVFPVPHFLTDCFLNWCDNTECGVQWQHVMNHWIV